MTLVLVSSELMFLQRVFCDETYHWSYRDLCISGFQICLASTFGGQEVNLFNYGAMDAFINGSSSNSDIRELLLCFEKLECNDSHWPWFSRVPSASNCADDPTRVRHVLGSFLQGAIRDSVCLPSLVWNFQILWAQRDLEKRGWMCFAPPACKKVLSFEEFLVRCDQKRTHVLSFRRMC